ncbi:MAG: hypothetical protein U0359_36750 [Byssovorax sp.]
MRPALTDENLEELLDRALRGERTAANQFARVIFPIVEARVSSKLLQMVNPRRYGDIPGMKEDCTQHVLATLFEQNWHKLRLWDARRGPLVAFIRMIAVKETAGWWVKRAKRAEVVDPDVADERPDPAPAQDRLAISREELRRIHEGMKKERSALCWTMYLLLFVDDLSVDEVRERMDMSEDAVFAWRMRIRRKIFQILSDGRN